jgi:transketolase
MNPFLVNSQIIKSFSDETTQDLEKIACVYRINCLAGLYAAKHGWLGASFSSIDLLTCIYHRYIINPILPINKRGSLHLSKGHAAMALYSVLAGRGCFEIERLSTYKAAEGLPAHCDRNVPGVDSDSGSLGQGLSKAIGVAFANRKDGLDVPVFAILGDGELQEGQLFEAFLTLRKLELNNCITIIDRNYLQTDSQTNHIKDAHDWARVFTHIGLNCMSIDGHNFDQIDNAIKQSIRMNAPLVIIAETFKGQGSELTMMKRDTSRREGVWHGQIPDDRQYISIVKELVIKSKSSEVYEAFKQYLQDETEARRTGEEAIEKLVTYKPGTGGAFGQSLTMVAEKCDRLFVLDADLEKSCRLTDFALKFPDRFVEIGISEQDMCSVAAGLALTGKIPVVNTYASFYKRGIDQIFTCITEKLPVIFAGHYAGADYFTDGKSHQSVNDIGLMRSLGIIDVFEPLSGEETLAVLEYLIERMKNEWDTMGRSRPAYIRLHRSIPEGLPEFSGKFEPDTPVSCYKTRVKTEKKSVLFASGPHMVAQAIEAAKILEKENVALNVVAITHFSDSNNRVKKIIENSFKIYTLEDHRRETGLGSFVASLEFRNPVRIGVREYFQSTRSLKKMFDLHKLTIETICQVVKKVLSCKHNK